MSIFYCAFDSPDEMEELVSLFAADGLKALLTPAYTDDDGCEWFHVETVAA